MGFSNIFDEGPNYWGRNLENLNERLRRGTLSAAAAYRLGHPELAGRVVIYFLPIPPKTCAEEIYYGDRRLGSIISFGNDGIIPIEEQPQ